MMEEELPKSSWGPGPWQDEPDRVEWNDERTGLPCRIVRNMMCGHLCGYVGVPPTHPYFGWGYDDDIKLAPGDLEDSTVDDVGVFDAFLYALKGGDEHGTIPLGMTFNVHHGITWSGGLPGSAPAGSGLGGHDLHWFGFDCGHAWDVTPAMDVVMRRHLIPDLSIPDRKYRDIDYVRKEVTSLAFQLRQLETRVLIDDGVLQLIGSSKT